MKRIEGFNVRIVRKGEFYGRDDCLRHDSDDSLVEFYDARFEGQLPCWPRGQFVSRYYRSTLLLGEFERGLCLEGAVPEWGVSPAGMREVIEFITEAA